MGSEDDTLGDGDDEDDSWNCVQSVVVSLILILIISDSALKGSSSITVLKDYYYVRK